MSFQIRIDSKYIAFLSQNGEPITDETIYGHEQLHVQNYVREMTSYLESDDLGQTGCMSPVECAMRSLQLQFQIEAKFDEFQLENRAHSYPEGPQAGLTPSPPLSPMPDAGTPSEGDLEDDWLRAVERAKGGTDTEGLFTR